MEFSNTYSLQAERYCIDEYVCVCAIVHICVCEVSCIVQKAKGEKITEGTKKEPRLAEHRGTTSNMRGKKHIFRYETQCHNENTPFLYFCWRIFSLLQVFGVNSISSL